MLNADQRNQKLTRKCATTSEHRGMTRNADIPAIPEFITHKKY